MTALDRDLAIAGECGGAWRTTQGSGLAMARTRDLGDVNAARGYPPLSTDERIHPKPAQF